MNAPHPIQGTCPDTEQQPERFDGQGGGPVPIEHPLAMPTQDLDIAPAKPRFGRQPSRTWAARGVTFGLSMVLSVCGTFQMVKAVEADGLSVPELLFITLFGITFTWIAVSACSALAGLLLPGSKQSGPEGLVGTNSRFALAMPVYNENPADTCAALEVMGRELHEAGVGSQFEIFILSDTTQAATWAQETACFQALRERLSGKMQVWYRRRSQNSSRKAGNIRDFVERWGGRYEAMLVLDADSLMNAATIIALARSIEEDPNLGIIQSVPRLADGTGLFARMQQFAGSVYGPVSARGMCAWQGNDGNYWGHNALIRTRAFAEASGLPQLPGRRPLGGDILSHDFVEAALVRKAGWRVSMRPELSGSWENSPPSLLDVSIRDRRWAQGNVQHLAVLTRRGIAWPNRVHFMIGVMSYAASPLWLLLILAGLFLSLQASLLHPDYFPNARTLFPHWPKFDSERMIGLFIVSMSLLLMPKIIGYFRILLDSRASRLHGGRARFSLSVLLEIVLSALYAPITMLMQSRQLFDIVRGKDSGWSLQSRDSQHMPWSLVWRRHYLHCAAGLLLTALLWFLAPQTLPWIAPITIGLILAPVLSRLSADTRLGNALRRLGLLLSIEEVDIPKPFLRRDECLPHFQQTARQASVESVFHDTHLRSRHYRSTLPRQVPARGDVDTPMLMARERLAQANSIDELLTWLSNEEQIALLKDAGCSQALDKLPERQSLSLASSARQNLTSMQNPQTETLVESTGDSGENYVRMN